MAFDAFTLKYKPAAVDYIEAYARLSQTNRFQVGELLRKAEMFETAGIARCDATRHIHCVGQYSVLPVKTQQLYAFVELEPCQYVGDLFYVQEVVSFTDLKRAWKSVYRHFGYELGGGGY